MASVGRASPGPQRFSLGHVVATPGVLEAFIRAQEHPLSYLLRHRAGDWGDVSEADRRENEFSVDRALRLFSAYVLRNGVKIWIITEADRSATTILLPEEY